MKNKSIRVSKHYVIHPRTCFYFPQKVTLVLFNIISLYVMFYLRHKNQHFDIETLTLRKGVFQSWVIIRGGSGDVLPRHTKKRGAKKC